MSQTQKKISVSGQLPAGSKTPGFIVETVDGLDELLHVRITAKDLLGFYLELAIPKELLQLPAAAVGADKPAPPRKRQK